MTSITTLVMGMAIFQRRSRSGWLDELDGIRHDALASPGGEVAVAMAASTVPGGGGTNEWPEPEEPDADDQYGIASLYATDEPQDPPAAAPRGRSWTSLPDLTRKGAPTPTAAPEVAAPEVEAPVIDLAELPPPPAPVAPVVAVPSELPPPPPAVAPAAEVQVTPAAELDELAAAERERAANWAQPAPHPIRPSELWHAAVAPAPVADEPVVAIVPEERVDSADLLGSGERRRFPSLRPVVGDDDAPASVEDALLSGPVDGRAPAPVDHGTSPLVPLAPAASGAGLINGPVARRVRRDRPADRIRTPLPLPGSQALPDRSPLPEAPLPPAAPPARVVAPAARILPPAAQPVTTAPAAPPVPAPVEELPVIDEPVPAPVPAAVPLAVQADGTVELAGTTVRLGGARRASALGGATGPEIELTEGWVWVAPAAGEPVVVRIELPGGCLAVQAGATVLAVVEADRSTFLLVAAGNATLSRGRDEAPLRPGTMVMLAADGSPQIDVAEPAEIEADPIVAENRALDAQR